jgi:tRNA(Ile)-lysidine synthase
MSRTHPPTLLTLAARTAQEAELWRRGDLVLAAVSGGGDSMALLHVLALLRKRFGHEVVAHGVDHGLRVEAASELDLAERVARSLDVPMSRSRLKVAPGGNLQARARAVRLNALREEARRVGANVIATGHHADDRAETVLLRMLRGAGPRGLAALPARSGDLVRPLLRARRMDVLAHLARHELPYASDPSNVDPRFLRVRVRHELLPLLEQLSPGIVGHLTALADQLGESVRHGLYEGKSPENGSEGLPSGAHMDALPRASRQALAHLGRTKSAKARVTLPKGLVALYDRGQLSIIVERSPERDWVRWKKH